LRVGKTLPRPQSPRAYQLLTIEWGRWESWGGEENFFRSFSPSHRTLRSRLSDATSSRSRPFAHSKPPNRFLREEKIRKACGGGGEKLKYFSRVVSFHGSAFICIQRLKT